MKTENVDYLQIHTYIQIERVREKGGERERGGREREREREGDETNVTNDDVFRSVCRAYLKPIFVVCADMTHSP
jgi:hypothetical protein